MPRHAGGAHTDDNAHSCYVKEGHGVTIPVTRAHLVTNTTYSQHQIVDNAAMCQYRPLRDTRRTGGIHQDGRVGRRDRGLSLGKLGITDLGASRNRLAQARVPAAYL